MFRKLAIAFTLIAVLGIVIFAISSNPAVLRWAIDQARAAGVKITAREVSGNLFFGVNAKDATVKLDFLSAQAGEVQVHYDAWALLTRRELRVSGKISDAIVSFDPRKLPQAGTDPQAPIKLVLEGIELERVKLRLDGRAWFIPDVRATILEQKNAGGPGSNGSVRVKLETDDGAGIVNASYRVPEDMDFRVNLDGDLDARIARYWFKGIERGHVLARYTITPHGIEGEGNIVNAALEGVPGVHLTDLNGPVKHRADGVIEGTLEGQVMGGPLRVKVNVDTLGQHLNVTGGAKPRVQDGLNAFKTGLKGSGALEISVRGGGPFEQLRFEGDASLLRAENQSGNQPGTQAATGEVAGFPLENLHASYAFITPGDRLEVKLNADSRLIDGPVGVTGSIASQSGVTDVSAKINGDRVLGSPVAISGDLRVLSDGSLTAEARGRGLGGSLRAKATMNPAQVWTMQGAFENLKAPIPIEHSASGTATATGKIGALEISANLARVNATIPGVKAHAFSGTTKFSQRGQGLGLDARLNAAQGQRIAVLGDLNRGRIELENLGLETGAQLTGTANYALGEVNRFAGRIALSNIGAGGVSLESVSGPFSLEVGERIEARFNAPQVDLQYDGNSLMAQPKSWRASFAGQDLKLSGNLGYTVSSGALTGSVRALGSLGQLEATAEGNHIALNGDLVYQALTARLSGSGTLQPLAVQLQARPTSQLRVPLMGTIQARIGDRVEVMGSISSGANRTVQLSLENGQPVASGGLDLAALDAILPPDARGKLSGTVFVDFKNTVGNAVFDGRYADFPVSGRAALRGNAIRTRAQVTGGSFAGLRLEGQVLPKLEAHAAWRGLNARIQGVFSSLAFTVDGLITDQLPGIDSLIAAGVELGSPRVQLDGRFENSAINASGSLNHANGTPATSLRITRVSYRDGALEARYQGQLAAQYRGKPVLLHGLDGNAKFQDGGLEISTRGASLNGHFEGQDIELGAYRLDASLAADGRLEARLNATRAYTKRPEGVLRAAPLIAKATLTGSRLETDLRAAMTGTWNREDFEGELRGVLGLDPNHLYHGWTGQAQLALRGQDWRVDASGPWSTVQLRGRAPTRLLESFASLSLPENLSTVVVFDGRASLPELRYDASFEASLGKPAGRLEGTIHGKAADYRLSAMLKDAKNGLAKLNFASDTQGRLELNSFNPVGLIGAEGALDGDLRLEKSHIAGSINGALSGLPITANWREDGRFDGTLDGPVPLEISAQGWRFPLEIKQATWRSMPQAPFQTQGVIRVSDGVRADGTLHIPALGISLPGGTARLEPIQAHISAQIAPQLRLELRQGEAGRVRFDGQNWSGALGLAYRAWDGLGRVDATLAGALIDPTLSFEAHGPLTAEGSISRLEIAVTGGLDLKGASGALPDDLRARLQSGRASFTANGSLQPLTVRGAGEVVNASVDNEAVRLAFTGTWSDNTWSAQGDVGLGSGETGSSETHFEADQNGLNAPKIDLDLRILRLIGLRAEGRARGTASLPGWSIERGQAALVIDGARVEGVRGSGMVELTDGNLGAALSGTLPGDLDFAVNGPLYPLAQAQLKLDGLEGDLHGRLSDRRSANLTLTGSFMKKAARLEASISGEALGFKADWAAATATASGTLDANGIGLNGTLEIPDLQAIAGVNGHLSAELEARNLKIRANGVQGSVEGFEVTGGASFDGGALGLEAIRLRRDGLDLRASGNVLPELGLRVQGLSTLAYAPGRIEGKVSGTIDKPSVKLTGALETAKTGLIAPGTSITASLEGQAFDIALGGERVSGSLKGTIPNTSGGGLENFDLALNAPVIWSGANLPVKGRLRWSESAGFDGALNTRGEVMGRQLDASLTGRGALEVGLDWRGAQLSATLPARLDGPLDGALHLARFDLGALWGKPDALWVESTGTLKGDWNAPKLRMAGRVTGALEAGLMAEYQDGRASTRIVGDGISVNAALDGADWHGEGQLKGLALDAKLLPPPFKRLKLSGAFSASSQDTTIRATGLELQTELETLGSIEASGSANLKGQRLEADLNLRALDGQARVTGRYGATGDSLRVNIEGAKLEKLGMGLRGVAEANLELQGAALDPKVSGLIGLKAFGATSSDITADASIRASGRLLDPGLMADLTLNGAASGRFALEGHELTGNTPRLSLRGSGRWRDFGLDAQLQGAWPKLLGEAKLDLSGLPKAVSSFSLSASGDGRYGLRGDLVRGEVKLEAMPNALEPKLTGDLTFDASLEKLLENAHGRATGALKLDGTLTKPQGTLKGRLEGTEYAGVSLEDAQLSGDLKLGREKPLSLTASYGGGKAIWDGQNLNFEKLKLSTSGLSLLLDGQGRTDALDLRVTGALAGWANGELEGHYDGGIQANLRGTLGGLPLSVRASGKPNASWDGDLELRGLPRTALEGVAPAGANPATEDANAGTLRLKLLGPFAAPELEGNGLIAGVKLDLMAKLSPLTARIGLSNPDKGPESGEGTIELANGALSGGLKYTSNATNLALEASGTLQKPRAKLELSRNKARATASLGFENNQLDGQLELSDGQHGGTLKLSQDRLAGRIDGLDLGALGIAGYGGRIAIETNLKRGSGSLGFDGTAGLTWNEVKTPLEVPVVGWVFDGTGAASYASQPGQAERAHLEYRGSPGTIQTDLLRRDGRWTGTAQVRLETQGRGSANGDLQLDANGLRGLVKLENLKLNVSGVEASLTGNVALDRDSFRADGVAQALGGRVTLEEATGGLSDVIPALAAYTGRASGEIGYSARARLDAVRLEDIAPLKAVAPYISGRASGVVQLSDAVSTFQLSIPELTAPGTKDPIKVRLSLSGTASGTSNLRFSGTLGDVNARSTQANYGDSFLSGVVTGGELTGRLDLRRAPMHALLGAIVGPLPGEALVSGLARYTLPLERPLDGNMRLALEKVELTGGGDTLTGSGGLYYRKGGVELDNLKLDGAGSWRGSGRYTPDEVNLSLEFKDTTFTPILGLIPALKDVDPSAKGTLKLVFSGDYLNPRATLSIEDLRARFASINLAAKSMNGTLQDGALELTGAITSDETLGASLNTTLRARIASFSPVQLEGLSARAVGALDIKPVGRFENVVAEASGQSGGFKLNVTGKKGQGAFTLQGNLSPKLDLSFSGKDLEFAVPTYFVRESLLDANLRVVSQGRDYVITGNTDISRVLASSSANRDAPEQPEDTKVAAPEADTPRRESIYDRVRFDSVRINAPSGLRLQESFATLEAGGELLLTGTASSPQLNGTLEGVGNKGTLTIGPYTYAIQSANASFTPVDGILPVAKALGRTDVSFGSGTNRRTSRVDLNLTVRFRRDALGAIRYELDTSLTQYDSIGACPANIDPSRPDCLSQSELYGLVTLGSAQGLSAAGIGQSALNTVLNVFVLSEFTRAFRQATGVDVQVSTNVLNYLDQNLSDEERRKIGVAFTFGGYLSRQVYFQYQIDTMGLTVINLNYTTDDNRFSLRLFIPIQISGTDAGINNSEISASYNFSSLTSLTASLQQVTDGGAFGVTIRFGLAFRF